MRNDTERELDREKIKIAHLCFYGENNDKIWGENSFPPIYGPLFSKINHLFLELIFPFSS